MNELHQSLLDFVRRRVAEGRSLPSTVELQEAFRYRNETSIVCALESLEASGHLSRRGEEWGPKTPSVQLSLELPAECDPSHR